MEMRGREEGEKKVLIFICFFFSSIPFPPLAPFPQTPFRSTRPVCENGRSDEGWLEVVRLCRMRKKGRMGWGMRWMEMRKKEEKRGELMRCLKIWIPPSPTLTHPPIPLSLPPPQRPPPQHPIPHENRHQDADPLPLVPEPVPVQSQHALAIDQALRGEGGVVHALASRAAGIGAVVAELVDHHTAEDVGLLGRGLVGL